ncbi:ribonuclease H-like YkuK family protein [Niabella terrae]
MDQQWRTFDGRRLGRSLEEEVRALLLRESEAGHQLKVCIGTDSQVKSRETEFATVIVFIRRGRGGFMLISKERSRQRMRIKERMLAEVQKSIATAYELCDVFTAFNTDLELHVDINTNPAFKSNDALSEAMGYINAMGFACRAKPAAFASSCCANKMVQ